MVEIADANAFWETVEIKDKSKIVLFELFFANQSCVAITWNGFRPALRDSSNKCVPSIQKDSFSFVGKLSLKDLNLFINGLFLLVIRGGWFSIIR